MIKVLPKNRFSKRCIPYMCKGQMQLCRAFSNYNHYLLVHQHIFSDTDRMIYIKNFFYYSTVIIEWAHLTFSQQKVPLKCHFIQEHLRKNVAMCQTRRVWLKRSQKWGWVIPSLRFSYSSFDVSTPLFVSIFAIVFFIESISLFKSTWSVSHFWRRSQHEFNWSTKGEWSPSTAVWPIFLRKS